GGRWRKNVPRRNRGKDLRLTRRALRSRPASGRRLELSWRNGRSFPGKHEHRGAASDFQQWLWSVLEQHVANTREQPVRPLPVHRLRGCRQHRLLLLLWTAIRPPDWRVP